MKPHLFLNNPRGEQRKFNAQRKIETEELPAKAPGAYRRQKERLRIAVTRFSTAITQRVDARTLQLAEHIEYIRVHFYIVFNNNEPFKTKSRFLNRFGLAPVAYFNFNQSVLFAIQDRVKFERFLELLRQFYESRNTVSPLDTPYAIMTLIHDFELLETASIIEGAPGEDVIISLVKPTDSIQSRFRTIYNALRNHLQDISGDQGRNIYTDEVSTIEIRNIGQDVVREIANNFDIIYRIQSLRVPAIGVDAYNQPGLTWNVQIDPPSDESVVIGVIDNGVRPIDPLRDILVDSRLDLTNPRRPNALQARHPHGTIVATLAATGMDFFDTSKTRLAADALILPIKILDFDAGFFNIHRICEMIRTAAARGVRIFNLSVTGPGKLYNAPVSEYAFLLDQLAWELDILIFIATGNLGIADIEEMQDNPDLGDGDLHTYPNHFYNPNQATNQHVCEGTNLCSPAESHNNCSVGAIADNLQPDSATSLTPFKELPAYYTRKWHLDYAQKVNGTDFSPKQMNHNLNKPDIVMPGGDLLEPLSKMQVFGFGDRGTDFFALDSGTSYAAPLAANLAAKIIRLYPALNMQSAKALILNSADPLLGSDFLDELVADIREQMAQERFDRGYDELSRGEKKQIGGKLSSDDLYKRLVGFGMPVVERALFSDTKAVTLMIQDSISLDSHKVINLNLPKYLLKHRKASPILSLKATLCYKFPPVWNNQLGYNPLHISFNFVRSMSRNNPVETAAILSDREHPFNQRLKQQAGTPQKTLKARQEAYGIKAKIGPWSEDFFPPATKPFANTQQLELNISKDEIRKVGGQISIIVRCTCKRDLERAVLDDLQQTPPAFSIALTVAERENSELSAYDLYDELMAINELDAINELAAEDELDAEEEEDAEEE